MHLSSGDARRLDISKRRVCRFCLSGRTLGTDLLWIFRAHLLSLCQVVVQHDHRCDLTPAGASGNARSPKENPDAVTKALLEALEHPLMPNQ